MKTPLTLLLTVTLTLFITGCGDGGSGKSSGLDALSPYKADSPYQSALKNCALAEEADKSCTISTLPPLGMASEPVSVDSIMDRVLVSHTWMGQRFEALLKQSPDDLIQLFGGITTIAIGADIRPSYYLNLTGGIYLDPANLWLTQAEKNVISREEDFRAAYADPMNFRAFWTYTKGNARAYTQYGLDSTATRSLSDIIIPMSSLLFHELAHANDFLPPTQYGSIDRSQRFVNAVNATTAVSDVLTNMFGLTSVEMTNIARILYRGAAPSSTDLARTALEIGGFFESDVASDDYAYSSQYEDLAMLFEETMMKKHFNVDRNIAFVSNPKQVNNCDDYKVGWGVRNRIGETDVKSRAAWVITQLLPDSDYGSFIETLPYPQPLKAGSGWCASLVITPAGAAADRRSEPHELLLDHMLRPYPLIKK